MTRLPPAQNQRRLTIPVRTPLERRDGSGWTLAEREAIDLELRAGRYVVLPIRGAISGLRALRAAASEAQAERMRKRWAEDKRRAFLAPPPVKVSA